MPFIKKVTHDTYIPWGYNTERYFVFDLLQNFLTSNKYIVNSNNQILNDKLQVVSEAQVFGELFAFMRNYQEDVDLNLVYDEFQVACQSMAQTARKKSDISKLQKLTDPRQKIAYQLYNSYFFYSGSAENKLFECIKYKNGDYGLNLDKYENNVYVSRKHIVDFLPLHVPECGIKNKYGATRPNLSVLYQNMELREFWYKPWQPHAIMHSGRVCANTWHPTYWWRVRNNELFNDEKLLVGDAALEPIEHIVEGVIRHTLNCKDESLTQNKQSKLLIKALVGSVSGEPNRKALFIFGASRSGKSLICQELVAALHGQGFYSGKVDVLFKNNQFKLGVAVNKTAIGFDEIQISEFILPFLSFLSSSRVEYDVKNQTITNSALKQFSIFASSNNEEGERAFRKADERLMSRVIILTANNEKLLDKGTVRMADGKERPITKADIQRLVNMGKEADSQALHDQTKFADWLFKLSEDVDLDIDDEEIQGYMQPHEKYRVVYATLVLWQKILIEVIVKFKPKYHEQIEVRGRDNFYKIEQKIINEVLAKLEMDEDCCDSYKATEKRNKITFNGIIKFFYGYNPTLFGIGRAGNNFRLYISADFVDYLEQEIQTI